MSDGKRLGRYVLARRVELGFKVRGDFAEAVGVSGRVIGDLETGRRDNFDPVTISRIEQALDWETGSAQRIAEGGEPTVRVPKTVEAKAYIPTPTVNDQVTTPVSGSPRSSASPLVAEQIELIYESRSLTTEQKLHAITRVLQLAAELESEGTSTHQQPTPANNS